LQTLYVEKGIPVRAQHQANDVRSASLERLYGILCCVCRDQRKL
jgi:hypothetical protein